MDYRGDTEMSMARPSRIQKLILGGCRFTERGWEYRLPLTRRFVSDLRPLKYFVDNGYAYYIDAYGNPVLPNPSGKPWPAIRLTPDGEAFHRQVTNSTHNVDT